MLSIDMRDTLFKDTAFVCDMLIPLESISTQSNDIYIDTNKLVAKYHLPIAKK